MKKSVVLLSSLFWLSFFITISTFSQPSVEAWGNMTGIRIDGQLMKFESSIRVVSTDWSEIKQTAKERQRPVYHRDGKKQIITTRIDSLSFEEVVEESGTGLATVNISYTSRVDTSFSGVFFCISLPVEEYGNGNIQLINPSEYSLSTAHPSGNETLLQMPAKGARFLAAQRQFEVLFDEPTMVIVKKSKDTESIEVYLPIVNGNVEIGQSGSKTFKIDVTGDVDRNPVTLALNTSVQGRAFAGMGGNFRLQNPDTDPQVIDYCLENMRVAWARVEFPWFFWHPSDTINPLENARAGNINPRLQKTIDNTKRLHDLGLPIVLSAWFPPNWSIEGEWNFRRRRKPGDPWGKALDQSRAKEIYKSITDYIIFLKEEHGVEINMFSFNESDLGIYVRQTGAEHQKLIKELGAYFKSKGLNTKMLLGDTADANGWAFINEAMDDPETHPYIGAVSFHSWRGWENETLKKWADAATRMNIPLLVGEGSTDAAAHRYPEIFEEEVYILNEINLYLRIMAICQPLSILQWQLTADYSPMAGGGIFGDDGPLRPTQRFWNFKQLGSTPEGLYAMPINSDHPEITCAALGDNEKGIYAIHLVNNGATREVTLQGLPDKIRRLQVFVTDANRNMEEGKKIKVYKGQANFTIDTVSFLTLVTD
jgi:hypothetical protein